MIVLLPYVTYLMALAICGVAFWKGDRPLRLAAAVLIASWTLSPLVSKSKSSLDFPVTIVDTHAVLAFVWISMRWRRLWCAALAASTFIILLIPIVTLADRNIHKYNHMAANNIVSIFQLVLMLVAIWLTVRARSRANEVAT